MSQVSSASAAARAPGQGRPWWRLALSLLLLVLLITPWSLHHLYYTRISPPSIWPLPEDPAEARKARMINQLLPLIQDSNRRILERRNYAEGLLDKLRSGSTFDRQDREWLTSMGRRFRLPLDAPFDEPWLGLLLRRLDVIPADLALAQAALESGWGESRFAVEGNNYFGHWCFQAGCGLVPAQRPTGARHEVAAFDSPRDSVRRYMRNLNSHPRYTSLRLTREKLRTQQQPITGLALVDGLDGYSASGAAYMRTVRGLIRANQLDRFPSY